MPILYDPERGILALELVEFSDIVELQTLVDERPELHTPVCQQLLDDSMLMLRRLGELFVVYKMLTLKDDIEVTPDEIDDSFAVWVGMLVASHVARMKGARDDSDEPAQKTDTAATKTAGQLHKQGRQRSPVPGVYL